VRKPELHEQANRHAFDRNRHGRVDAEIPARREAKRWINKLFRECGKEPEIGQCVAISPKPEIRK
jgi:hypothetical protein